MTVSLKPNLCPGSVANLAVERIAGSHSLAAAAHRSVRRTTRANALRYYRGVEDADDPDS